MATNGTRRVVAAGTVVLRRGDGAEPEVLLVHRPGYDDWSLPKGKLFGKEYLAACAFRETVEETAVMVRLGIPVDRISYPVGSGTKRVHYWRAEAVREGKHRPNAEIDQVAWLPVSQALRTLTYADEKALINQAVGQPTTTALVIVRHSKAMLRSNWSGRDEHRPLDELGRRQSRVLMPLLDAYGVGRLVSSTAIRCTSTLQPYAKSAGLEVEGWGTLTEDRAGVNPQAVTTLMRRLARQAVEAGVPIAICGHRPVLPGMLTALDVSPQPMRPAAAVIVHLDERAQAVAVEIQKPRL